jgi:hypothetical protein
VLDDEIAVDECAEGFLHGRSVEVEVVAEALHGGRAGGQGVVDPLLGPGQPRAVTLVLASVSQEGGEPDACVDEPGRRQTLFGPCATLRRPGRLAALVREAVAPPELTVTRLRGR